MLPFLALLLASLATADKPAVAPAYTGPAQAQADVRDTRDAPAADTYGAPVAAPSQDSYGSPQAAPASAQEDSYGAPQAAAITEDSYGAPQAAPVAAGGPGNQGYYYYYYPVRQNVPQEGELAEDDGGLLGGLLNGGLAGLLTTKVLLLILGVAGFVLITSLGINLGGRRSFTSRALSLAEPYMTHGNLIQVLESVNSAMAKYQ